MYFYIFVMQFTFGLMLKSTIDDNITEINAFQNSTFISSENKRSFVEEFLFFMQQHSLICGYIPLCTLIKQDNAPSSRWCHECSCNVTCVTENTCCPDFWLMSTLNLTSPFDTTSELQKYMLTMNESQMNSIESVLTFERQFNDKNSSETDLIDFSPLQNDTLPPAKCTRMGLTGYNVPENLAFRVIVTCPDETPYELAQNCENNTDITNLTDHIPMTVIKERISFKNRHCLKCNGYKIEEADMWNVWTFCHSLTKLLLNQHTFEQILANVLYLESCYLQFLPNAILIQGGVDSCDKYDMDVCQKTNSFLLNYICHFSTSPVEICSGSKLQSAKNLGCFLCDENITDASTTRTYECRNIKFQDVPGVMFDLKALESRNQMLGHGSDSQLAVDDANLYRGGGVIQRSFYPVCNSGYAFDSYKKTCTRVYCQSLHVLVDGQCKLMYTHVKHVCVGLSLLAMLKTDFKQNRASVRRLMLHQVHADILFESRRHLSVDSNVSLWLRDDDSDGKYMFVYVTLQLKELTLDMLFDRLVPFLNTFNNLTNGGVISDIMFTSQFVFSRVSVFDMKAGERWTTKVSDDSHHAETELVITDNVLCPSVLVKREDIRFMSSMMYSLKYANLTIYSMNGISGLDSSNVFVCYKHVQKEPYLTTSPRNNDVKATREEESTVSKALAITVLLAGILIILIGIRAFKWIRQKGRIRNQVA